jgi:hypothetical protein
MPIRQSSTNFDVVVAPIKARACDALLAVLKSSPRLLSSSPRVMSRGSERC